MRAVIRSSSRRALAVRVPVSGPSSPVELARHRMATTISRSRSRAIGSGGRPLPLRFQKQFRFSEDARADYGRADPPSDIESPGLPRIAMMFDKDDGHSLEVLHVDAGHRPRYFIARWVPSLP